MSLTALIIDDEPLARQKLLVGVVDAADALHVGHDEYAGRPKRGTGSGEEQQRRYE